MGYKQKKKKRNSSTVQRTQYIIVSKSVRYFNLWTSQSPLQTLLLAVFFLLSFGFCFHRINTKQKGTKRFLKNRKRRIFVCIILPELLLYYVCHVFKFLLYHISQWVCVCVCVYLPDLNKLLRRISYIFRSTRKFERGGHFPHAGYSTLRQIFQQIIKQFVIRL